jgi:hypothetical protein
MSRSSHCDVDSLFKGSWCHYCLNTVRISPDDGEGGVDAFAGALSEKGKEVLGTWAVCNSVSSRFLSSLPTAVEF